MSSRKTRFAGAFGAHLFAIAGLVAATTIALASETHAADPAHDFTVTDSSRVYYGKKKHPKTPAHCDADSVWSQIPEYKTIIEDELGPDDARYHLLLKRATKRFQRALKKLSKRDGYDLIAEVGAVKAVGKKKKKIPTVTSDLIDFVTRD